MVINVSRIKTFRTCSRKAFHSYHNALEGPRAAPLTDGSAFHAGVAVGLATKDWSAAEKAARVQFEEDAPKTWVYPEEQSLANDHWDCTREMVKLFASAYDEFEYQIIQPECEFDVELPGSGHNCIFEHWVCAIEAGRGAPHEVWNTPPDPLAIASKWVLNPHRGNPDSTCQCYKPHRLVGKTDAVVLHGKAIWLFEHKTSAWANRQDWWDQWLIDIQPTGYIYGIWKGLGLEIRPRGVIINGLRKPSQREVSSWNARRKYGPDKGQADYLEFRREAFVRTDEQIDAFVVEAIDTANEWERRVVSGVWPKANVGLACFAYYRQCDYYSLCIAEQMVASPEGALVERETDYVQIKQAG